MKKIGLIVVLLCANFIALAQNKIEEGVMVSKQTLSTNNDEMKAVLEQMGDMVTTTYFKGQKSKAEISNPMSGDMVIITDNENKQMLMLMDNPMLGKKFQKQSLELSEEDLKGITVKDGKGSKTILGYQCKEKIITINQGGADLVMYMYLTDKIVTIPNQQTAALGEKLNGTPLLMTFEINQMGNIVSVTNEVTEIRKEKIDDSMFSLTPPEGYTELQGM